MKGPLTAHRLIIPHVLAVTQDGHGITFLVGQIGPVLVQIRRPLVVVPHRGIEAGNLGGLLDIGGQIGPTVLFVLVLPRGFGPSQSLNGRLLLGAEIPPMVIIDLVPFTAVPSLFRETQRLSGAARLRTHFLPCRILVLRLLTSECSQLDNVVAIQWICLLLFGGGGSNIVVVVVVILLAFLSQHFQGSTDRVIIGTAKVQDFIEDHGCFVVAVDVDLL
mmetsp:Transcript_27504/g.77105  ORF Transcript_27504/g.77105 Transcript_27504/m.77105 type:complete len:219 (+) Transcript_27504:113-769(+)